MRVVLYRRTAAAIEMASLLGTFFCRCFVCCCSGGRWGDMEQVVARWRIQWLPEQPWTCRIGQCHLYHSSAPLWPSKQPVDEVHLFDIVALFVS
jgi:hypothetical protein